MKRLIVLNSVVVFALLFSVLASAVVFEQYPPILAKNGRFDAVIIIGEDAAIRDSLSTVEVINNLQEYFKEIEETAKKQLAEQLAKYQEEDVHMIDDLQIDECIGDQEEVITEADLPKLLQGGMIRTQADSTNYEQYLRFQDVDDDIGCTKVVYESNEADELDTYLFAEEGDTLFEYELSFGSGLTSRISDDNTLRDLIDEQVNMLGRTYRIADARVSSNEVDLRLIQGEKEDTLQEGMTETYNIGGATYNVNVLIVSDSANGGRGAVKFRVNGQVTRLLSDGESETLSDGTIIGVRNVIPNEAGEQYQGNDDISEPQEFDASQYEGLSPAELEAILGEQLEQDRIYRGGGDIVEFFIGAHVLRFTDRANDDTFSQGIKVNFDTLKNGRIQIKGDTVDDEYKIYTIRYRLEAQSKDGEDIFVPFDHGMREYLNNPGDLISPVWDIRYGGLGSGEGEPGSSIIFRPGNNEGSYDLHFTNNRGDDYKIPLLNNEGGFLLGDDENRLFFIECANTVTFCIPIDSYFVVTDKNDHRGLTNVLQYVDIDTGSKSITFEDIAGNSVTKTYSGTVGVDAQADIIVGGNTYRVFIGLGADDNPIAMDFTKDGDVDGSEAKIIVQGGGILDLGTTNVPAGSFTVTLTTEESQIEDASSDEVVTWDVEDRGGNKVGITLIDQASLTLTSEDGHDKGITDYGVRFDFEDETNGEKLTIVYPGAQSQAQVSIIASESLAPENLSLEGLFSFEGITIGAFTLDSDVQDIYAQNILVVGGPCANDVAKQLLGDYEPCTAGFEEGKAILRIFNLQSSFAILAAGYSAEDTNKAAQVLAHFKDYPFFIGTFVEISGPSDNLKFRQLTAKEWQDRVDLDMIKKEESSKLNVTEGKNITEEVNVTTVAPAEQPEEQGTLEELGFSRPEEPFVVEANQNVMLVIGLLIFVGVILLIGFMNYRHAKQEKSDEHKKHPHHEVAGLKFKNLPKHVEEEPEEESEEDNKESEEEKEDEEEKKSEKAKEKDEEEKHKQHPAHHGEEKKVHEKKSEKKEAKSKHSKDDPEDEVEDLNFEELGKELTEAREAHKKRR